MSRKQLSLFIGMATVVGALLLLLVVTVSADPDPAAPDLLLSELVVTPTGGEFIEIYNPTGSTIDLTDVYVTDATYAPGGVYYYKIVTGVDAGGGDFSDFHARFPAGASIGPDEYQTIALNGSTDFNTEYGVDPTYELYEDDAAPDAVPDMLEAFPGSINGQGGLSNSGEVVILYYWNGASDLVTDLDYTPWGDKAEAVDKTGVSIDGPDGDTNPSTYLDDTAIPDQDVVASGSHASGESWQRKDMTEGSQKTSGGNGVGGGDETSEDLSVTWCTGAPTPNASTACFAPPAVELKIHEIQGAQHLSPYEGDVAGNVPGIVIATRSFGFYMQDPLPDGDDATSEGLFILSSASVAVGDSVVVTGTVQEYYPGGYDTNNLSITQIDADEVVVQSSGNPLPAPTIIGIGGRIPPMEVIDDTSTGDANTKSPFEPDRQGLDFYESLEGMYVQVNDAVATSGTTRFGEISVLSDNGANASVRSARGGIVIRPTDFNPERVIVDDAIIRSEPKVHVGNMFDEPIVGVMDYNFGNFKLLNTEPLSATIALPPPDVAAPPASSDLLVATFNVLNLDPGDPADKFEGLADTIANLMQAPDIIALEEIQDNTGGTDDGTVDASLTYQALIDAITAAGGPLYDWRDIPPLDNQDGGAPGSNIRVGFLFRPDRVQFVDRPGGDATTATEPVMGPGGVMLTLSPGRVDPNNPAWAEDDTTGYQNSRKSLAGEFTFRGQKVFVIGNHFKSKSGDTPLFGRPQPPVLGSEVQRKDQAAVINGFVADILALDPTAKVIVLGDLNDFDFSAPLQILKGAGSPPPSDSIRPASVEDTAPLTNLVEMLPLEERYSFIYNGNSQTLDHILVSDGLLGRFKAADIVHANADYSDAVRASDHDPVLAYFSLSEEYRFWGHTYQGLPRDTSTPMGGVTVRLYGRNAGEPEPGSWMDTTVSAADGYFTFYIVEPYVFDYFTMVAEAPAGMVATGAWSETGTVVGPDTVQWADPEPRVHWNEFYFDIPTPTPTPTDTPTPTETPTPTPSPTPSPTPTSTPARVYLPVFLTMP